MAIVRRCLKIDLHRLELVVWVQNCLVYSQFSPGQMRRLRTPSSLRFWVSIFQKTWIRTTLVSPREGLLVLRNKLCIAQKAQLAEEPSVLPNASQFHYPEALRSPVTTRKPDRNIIRSYTRHSHRTINHLSEWVNITKEYLRKAKSSPLTWICSS